MSGFFLGSDDLKKKCPKGVLAHLCCSQSAVSIHCMQINIWKQSGNDDNLA